MAAVPLHADGHCQVLGELLLHLQVGLLGVLRLEIRRKAVNRRLYSITRNRSRERVWILRGAGDVTVYGIGLDLPSVGAIHQGEIPEVERVIEDTESAAHNRLGSDLPGDAETRRKIVRVIRKVPRDCEWGVLVQRG